MKHYTRVYASVDLDCIIKNIESLCSNLSEGTGVIGVVKADGYGHGAVPVAKAIAPYVWGYAVATIEEAVVLKNHGISKPILILGVTHPSRFKELVRYGIRSTVFQLDKARHLSDIAVSLGVQAKIHIALDTGMSRIGFSPVEASADDISAISRLPGIHIEGIFTHFAKADAADKEDAKRQLDSYHHFQSLLMDRSVSVPIKHCSNSAGMIDLREANLDMVRAGISLYGLYPSDEVQKNIVNLYPAMELKSFVTYIKTICPGTPVSYGGTFIAQRKTIVATVPVGYGDGYPRNLSNKGSVLIHGREAGILGRVCMDQMMVDVTDIPDVKEDDVVTLIGRDGEYGISVEDLARIGGGFHYEIICDLGKRVPRVYLKDGEVIGSKDYFDDRYGDFD